MHQRGVPHTITGKKLQVPVMRILQGAEIEQVADRGSIDNPSALQRFTGYRAERARKGLWPRLGAEPQP